MRRLRAAILLAWCGILAPVAAAELPGFFQTSFGDYPDELRQLRQDGKRGLVLVFEMEECPYCKRFHDRILKRRAVVEAFRQDFNLIRVDVLGAGSVLDFAGRSVSEGRFAEGLKVRGTPTTIAFDRDGKEIARFSGVPVDAAEFLLWRQYVLSETAARQSFGQFKAGRR